MAPDRIPPTARAAEHAAEQLRLARIAWKARDDARAALDRARTRLEARDAVYAMLHAERELGELLGPKKPETREPEPVDPHGDIPGKPGLPITFED